MTHSVIIKKTGQILVKPYITKGVSKGQTLNLSDTEYQAATAQGFLDDGGVEKAAKSEKKSNKRPGKNNSPADETK